MSAPYKTLVKELLAAWSAGDIDRACACLAESCSGGGPGGLRRELLAFQAAFPDATITVDIIVAEGSLVATQSTIRGTHRGALMGIAPTGRSIELRACHFFRCASGRIVERYGQLDRVELLQQLGVDLDLAAGQGSPS